MADGNILSDFGINILEEEIDDVIFQTNEFLTNVPYEDNSIAFAARMDWDGASRNIYATLTHVVAKVTLKTTTAVGDKSSVTLSLPGTYTAYNVSEGSVAGTSGTYTFTTTAAGAVAKDAEVFSFYALLQENMQTVTIANGDYMKEVSNVPLAPNKHTVIKGDVDNIGLTSTTFMISIDDVWSDKVEKGGVGDCRRRHLHRLKRSGTASMGGSCTERPRPELHPCRRHPPDRDEQLDAGSHDL